MNWLKFKRHTRHRGRRKLDRRTDGAGDERGRRRKITIRIIGLEMRDQDGRSKSVRLISETSCIRGEKAKNSPCRAIGLGLVQQSWATATVKKKKKTWLYSPRNGLKYRLSQNHCLHHQIPHLPDCRQIILVFLVWERRLHSMWSGRPVSSSGSGWISRNQMSSISLPVASERFPSSASQCARQLCHLWSNSGLNWSLCFVFDRGWQQTGTGIERQRDDNQIREEDWMNMIRRRDR